MMNGLLLWLILVLVFMAAYALGARRGAAGAQAAPAQGDEAISVHCPYL